MSRGTAKRPARKRRKRRRGRRKPLVVAAVLTLATTVIVMVALNRTKKETDVPSESAIVFSPDPKTLFDRIHVLGAMSPSVAYVIETSEGLILVDSGMDAHANSILQQLTALDLDARRIRVILLTHAHGDHILGARRLREISGAKIYAAEADAQIIESGGPRRAVFSTFYMPGVDVHPTQLDVRLKGGEKVRLGDTEVTVLATPGHSPGSLCYMLQRSGERVLFTGDTITTYSGELGIYAAELSLSYRGNAGAYLSSLKMLRDLPPPDWLLPGHPVMSRGREDRPRITEQTWHRTLDRGIAELQTIVARHKADGADFLDGKAKAVLDDVYYLGVNDSQNVFVLSDSVGGILFDLPGVNLKAFLNQRLPKCGLKPGDLKFVLLTSLSTESLSGIDLLEDNDELQFVVPSGVLSEARKKLGAQRRLISLDDFNRQTARKIEAVSLQGPVASASGYSWTQDGKTVLISGHSLMKLNERNIRSFAAMFQLREDAAKDFAHSLNQIRVAPQVWLPANSVHDQNANLYDDQWSELIRDMLQVADYAGKRK